MTDLTQNKNELRQTLLTVRNAIAADQRLLWDSAMTEKILTCLGPKKIHTLGIYWPMRGEPALQELYAELHAQGVQLALPVVVSKDAPLKFFAWAPGERLKPDKYGTSVPAVLATELRPQALLIPCVGFNQERFRLGYGGGFYDRTLALAPRPYTIGLAYAVTETIFVAAPYDVALDVIITEKTIFSA